MHTVTNTYKPHCDVLLSKENKIGNTTISKHEYTTNIIGQRTQREQTGSTFATPSTEIYTYNTHVEMTATANTQRPALNTAYAYDGIGNRQTSQDGLGQRNYTSNTLYQYTSVSSVPSVVKSPTYDLDGNMTTTGDGTQYEWDAENRLAK